MKYAVFSLDIEDWYHLDYFRDKDCNKRYSFLDGINRFQEVISFHQIPASFFVVGELISTLKRKLRELDSNGHDLAVHGWSHVRPMKMDIRAFTLDVDRNKRELEDVLGKKIIGYRAPCFSLDRKRLDELRKIGFKYDSSSILFGAHPLYEEIDLDGFKEISRNIFRFEDFIEFQVSTIKLGHRQIPISGGGYLRIFPWVIMKRLLKRYMASNDFYVLYIHPFELSLKQNQPFPSGVTRSNKLRFGLGRSSVIDKLNLLIKLLKDNGFKFTTFSLLRKEILRDSDY